MRRTTATCLLLCLAVGCSGTPADQPDLGTVSGTITLDGSPLANAKVEFQPESGRPSYGVTNSQGEYELEYSPDAKGAKIGQHTVRITSRALGENAQGDVVVTQAEQVPDVYNTKTELSVTVEPGDNDVPFELDSGKGNVPASP